VSCEADPAACQSGPLNPGQSRPAGPGPQDGNRGSFDPNWPAHVKPYPSGQAPEGTGPPRVDPRQAMSVGVPVTVVPRGPADSGGGLAPCLGCTELQGAAAPGSGGSQCGNPFLPRDSPMGTLCDKLAMSPEQALMVCGMIPLVGLPCNLALAAIDYSRGDYPGMALNLAAAGADLIGMAAIVREAGSVAKEARVARAAEGGAAGGDELTLFHGTDIGSARGLLGGKKLGRRGGGRQAY
jgi:hypothetical protein